MVKALLAKRLEDEKIDVTLPGREAHLGSKHPINIILDDLESYFIGMGYKVVQGPEIETDHYCFEMMNLPKGHPARDMQATFYIDDENLLRSQTSGDQARVLEKHDFAKGPLKMVGPGKVYRRDDDDATHSHQFMQMEGLVVDKHVTMSDLKGTLEMIAKHVFGQDRATRLRPSYFPFTELSVKWMYPASIVMARAARFVSILVGLKFWVLVWFILMFWKMLALIPLFMVVLPLV